MGSPIPAASPRHWVMVIAGLAAAIGVMAWLKIAPQVGTPANAASNPTEIVINGAAMGGSWSVKLPHLPPNQTRDQLRSTVAAVLERVESKMSTYRRGSMLSLFNQYRGADWYEVPAELVTVVEQAQRVSEESDGAFDVTVGPLVNLWGFGPEPSGLRNGQIPSEAAIAAAKSHVGYQRLHCRQSPPALKKDDPEMYVDLSGIAKGYAVDQAARALDAAGATDYLITFNNEIRARGLSQSGRPWHAGIDIPTPGAHGILREVGLTDCGISNSGDYRSFFELGGHRYCHEIDPQTGRPIAHALASVSVIHTSSTYADAMSTALIVMGPDAGEALAKRLNVTAAWITRGPTHFETKWTTDFNTRLLPEPPAKGTATATARK